MPEQCSKHPVAPTMPRIVALSLALFAFGLTTTTSAGEFYDRALKRFRAEDFRGAIIELKNELQEQPGSVAARLLLGQSYLALRDAFSANRELRQALRSGADAALVLPLIAETYFVERNYDGFLGDFPAPRGGNDAAVIHAVRAEALLRINLPEEAEQEFAQALRAQPGNIGWRIGRARALLRLGRDAEARREVDTALEESPEDARAWFIKGELHRYAGDLQAAMENYGRALQLDPAHPAAKMSRAVTAMQLGLAETALRDKQDLQDLFPNNPQVLFLESQLRRSSADARGWREKLERAGVEFDALKPDIVETDTFLLLLGGTIHYQLGNREKALQHLSRYVRFVPHHVRARLMLADVQLLGGEIEAAVETLETVPDSSADDVEVLAMLGDAYVKGGRFDDAVRSLEAAVHAAPERADLRMAVGLARSRAGQADAAREDLRTALQMDPELLRASWALVHLEIEAGLVEEANSVAQAAVTRFPDNAAAHTLLGVVRIARNELDLAVQSLEHAETLQPDFREARRRLAQARVLRGELDLARAAYEELVQALPGDVDALTQLANIAEHEGRYADAIRWLERVREHDGIVNPEMPKLVELYLAEGRGADALKLAEQLDAERPVTPSLMMLLARVLISEGQEARAREILKVPYGLLFDSPSDLLELARLQLRAGGLDDARRSLDRALEVNADFVPAHATYVELDIRSNRLDAALARASNLRARYPELGLGDTLTADVHMSAKRYALAVQDYAAALAKDPAWQVALRLYQARTAAGDVDAALAGMAEWVDAHPTDRVAGSMLAVEYLRYGDWERARVRHEALFAQTPSDPSILNNLAWIYWKLDDPRALDHAREAYRLAPDSVDALDTLGWILVDGGAVAEGVHYLREAHVRDSRLPTVRYHLAVGLARLDRPSEARELLDYSLRFGGSFPERREAQALLDSLGER